MSSATTRRRVRVAPPSPTRRILSSLRSRLTYLALSVPPSWATATNRRPAPSRGSNPPRSTPRLRPPTSALSPPIPPSPTPRANRNSKKPQHSSTLPYGRWRRWPIWCTAVPLSPIRYRAIGTPHSLLPSSESPSVCALTTLPRPPLPPLSLPCHQPVCPPLPWRSMTPRPQLPQRPWKPNKSSILNPRRSNIWSELRLSFSLSGEVKLLICACSSLLHFPSVVVTHCSTFQSACCADGSCTSARLVVIICYTLRSVCCIILS